MGRGVKIAQNSVQVVCTQPFIKIRLWSMELFAKILKNQTNDISFRFVPVLEMLCLYLVSQEKFCTF